MERVDINNDLTSKEVEDSNEDAVSNLFRERMKETRKATGDFFSRVFSKETGKKILNELAAFLGGNKWIYDYNKEEEDKVIDDLLKARGKATANNTSQQD